MRRLLVSFAVAALAVAGMLATRSPEGLDVRAAAGPAAPPPGAVLVPGAWPEVAAFVVDAADAGRPTVVKFFASWCEPCRRELPRVVEAVGARDEIAFLGVDHEDRRDPATAFVDEFGLDVLPTVFDDLGETARALGLGGMPATAFFDRGARLVGTHLGPLAEDDLAAWLDALAAGGPYPS